MYLDRALLTALGSLHVKFVEQARREHDATGCIGFMRYRLTLMNDDLLELTLTDTLKCRLASLWRQNIAITGKTKRVS